MECVGDPWWALPGILSRRGDNKGGEEVAPPAVVAMTVASATSLATAGDCDDPAAGGYGTNRGRSGLADARGDSCACPRRLGGLRPCAAALKSVTSAAAEVAVAAGHAMGQL